MNSSQDVRNNDSKQQISVIVIPALLSAGTLLVVSIILWKTLCRKKMKKTMSGKEAADYVDAGCAVNAGGAYENSLVATDPGLEKEQLPSGWRIEGRVVQCSGHYGPISHAVLLRSGETEDRQHVVLKEVSDQCSPGEVQDFIDLIKFHVQVCRHDNLVRMLWCQTHRTPVCLIMKAMSHGCLLNFLRDSHEVAPGTQGSVCRITEKDVYSMASQVASGLEYLAGTHDLVHGYVAACNVLLHDDMSVQLCGLGLAAIQHRTGSVPARRACRVPLKWQSPERLKGGDVTKKGDVWSFGILLYEMITLGSSPHPGLEPSQLHQKLHRRHRMPQPQQCGTRLYEVMTQCWQWEALERPDIAEVLKQLQEASEQGDGVRALSPVDALSWREYLRVAGVSA